MGLTCGSHIVAEPVPSEPTSLKGEGKAVPLEQAVADDGKGSRLVLLGASTVAPKRSPAESSPFSPPASHSAALRRVPAARSGSWLRSVARSSAARRRSAGARRRERPRRRCDDRRPPSPLRRDDRRQRPRRWRGTLNPFARCARPGGGHGVNQLGLGRRRDGPPSHPRTIVGLDLPGTVRQSARNTCEHRADSAVETK